MQTEVTTKSDVYSFGIMLWELYMRRQAFNPHQTYAGFKHKICMLRERPPIPDSCPLMLANLMRACWDHDPGTHERVRWHSFDCFH